MLWFKEKNRCPQCGEVLQEPYPALKGDTVHFGDRLFRGGVTRVVKSNGNVVSCGCGYYRQE